MNYSKEYLYNMGVIQSNINSALTAASALITMNPVLQDRARAKAAGRRASKLEKTAEGLRQAKVTGTPEEQELKRLFATQEADAVTDQAINLRQEAFYQRPSNRTAQAYIGSKVSREQRLTRRYINANYADDSDSAPAPAPATLPVSAGAAQEADDRIYNVRIINNAQQQALQNRFDWTKLSVEERAQMLREGQHIQSQEKRRVQHERYEEGRNNGRNL